MSVVTGIMLILGAADWGRDDYDPNHEEAIHEIQAWLAEHWNGQQLVEVADYAGGRKCPQFEAWAAGINRFDEDGFIEFAMSREWSEPENVVLVMQPEDGPTRVFKPERRFGYVHKLSFEPQPIADQWKGTCSCGWSDTASLYETSSADEAIELLQKKHSAHVYSPAD